MSVAPPGPGTLMMLIGGPVAAVGILAWASRALQPGRVRTAIVVLLPLLPAAISATAAAVGWPESAWVPPLLLAAATALWVATGTAAARRKVVALRGPLIGGIVVAGLVATAWWSVSREPAPLPTAPRSENTEERRAAALAAVSEVRSPIALTDLGRPVRLYAMPDTAVTPGLLREMDTGMSEEWGPRLEVIRTGPADLKSDCHGWVFADGRWWIQGDDVDVILEDNGYRTVNDPAPGDLVVYRDLGNEITHTGLVWAAAGQRILVESKWAWLGVYLHGPDDQPYGGMPAYFRSSRQGHRLNLVSRGFPSNTPITRAPASRGKDARSKAAPRGQ